MNRKIVIAVLFVIIIGMAYGIMEYLASMKTLPGARKQPEVVRYVKSDVVEYDTIQTNIKGRGRVYSVSTVDVVAEGSGKIITGRIPLKKGQAFKKGDVLLTIYKDEVELALMARKSSFMQSVANLLPDLRMDYPDDYDGFFQFFHQIDVKKGLPEMPEVKSDQLKLFLASKNVLSEYYSILKDEKALRRYTKYAPFSGSYLEVNMEAGAYTNTGGRIAKIIKTDEVELEIPIEVFEAHFISIGDEVLLQGAEQHKGVVVRKSGFVDEGTQSQSIFVRIKGKNNPLPGEYFDALFKGRMVAGVMEVPRNAVFNHNEVFTIEEGRLHKKEVEVVKLNEKTMLIRGLELGSIIVTQPMIGVSDGVKVSRLKDAPKDFSKKQNSGGEKPVAGTKKGSGKSAKGDQ